MIDYPIKHKETVETLFLVSDIDCDDDAPESFKKGLAIFCVIKNKHSLKDADLSFSYLEGADLRGADLSGSDLQGSYLRNSNLQGSDLSYSNMCYSNLVGANLEGASLFDANLESANLRGANLRGANMFYASFVGAKNLETSCWKSQ